MTEPNTAMAAGMAHMHPRALASAASAGLVPSPPWGIGSVETGDAREPLPSGKSAVAPSPPVPPLTDEQAARVARWVELYAIRPVGIPADGAPAELWETRIIRDLRAWGRERRAERTCGEVDPLSGAACTRTAGHGFAHRAVDDGFEFGWTTA